jgi:hypothetical protein
LTNSAQSSDSRETGTEWRSFGQDNNAQSVGFAMGHGDWNPRRVDRTWGSEFRLPVLVSIFRFQTLQAIVLNLVVSLVTVFFSFFFRSAVVDFARVLANTPVILNILAGSLIGSYVGVHVAVKMKGQTLTKIVVILLVFLSMVLIAHDLIFRGDLESRVS